MTGQKVKVQRHPLAWGMTFWGPLPGTRDAHFFWGGSGDGLTYYPRHPDNGGGPGMPVRHPEGRGPFQTLKEAQRAVDRQVAIFLEAEAAEEAEGGDGS